VHTHAGAGRLSASTSIIFCHWTCVLTLTAYRPAILAHSVLQMQSLARHSVFSAALRDSQVACIGPCAEPRKRHGPALGAVRCERHMRCVDERCVDERSCIDSAVLTALHLSAKLIEKEVTRIRVAFHCLVCSRSPSAPDQHFYTV